MICPYCNKTVNADNKFCPECGQILTNDLQEVSLDAEYWEKKRNDEKERVQQYQAVIDEHSRIEKNHKNKSFIFKVSIVVIIVLVALGCYQYHAMRMKKLNMVKSKLPGVVLTCSDQKTTGLLSWKYVYYTLEFNEDGTVDYYEYDKYDDEPQFAGTYSYSVTQTFTGGYVINFHSLAFELEVASDYEAERISYKD